MSSIAFDQLKRAVLSKRAAEVLTPEAEQAAMTPPPAGGMPMDPAMAGGMPPAGGMPMDPAMMGGMPPQGAPMDPAMAGGMPPAGAPMPPAGGMPPQGGGIPPEILQDQAFMQFATQMLGVQFDPSGSMAIDTATGQPIPPELLMQAYQQFKQQEAGAGQDPAAGGAPEADPAQDQAALLEGVQSAIDASIQAYTEQLNKRFEAVMERLEGLTQAIESLRDTDDARSRETADEQRRLREDLSAELQAGAAAPEEPETEPREQPVPEAQGSPAGPVDIYELLTQGR